MIELQSSPTIAGEPRVPVRVDLASSSPSTAIGAVDRDLVTSIAISRRSRSRLCEFVPSIKGEIASSIAIDDMVVGLSSRSTAPSNPVERRSLIIFFLGFAGFVFSFFFSKH